MAKRKTTTKRKKVNFQPMAKRKTARKTTRRRSTRRRGLSQGPNIPILGKMGLSNPLIGGIIGAVAGMAIKNIIPDNLLKGKNDTEPHPLQPYIKGLALVGVGLLAKNYKQDAIAAGLIGTAAVLTLQNLQVPGLSERNGNWANPDIFLNDTALLSAGMYPDYMPMYDTALLSNQY
jgi:hypothetical protein